MMSRESSDSEELVDWALVSTEGSIVGDEGSSGSDDFVNLTENRVSFSHNRSPQSIAKQEENLGSSRQDYDSEHNENKVQHDASPPGSHATPSLQPFPKNPSERSCPLNLPCVSVSESAGEEQAVSQESRAPGGACSTGMEGTGELGSLEVGDQKPNAHGESVFEAEHNGASAEGGTGDTTSLWLGYPIEGSDCQLNTLRLGDGRVIVAPPGANLESLAAFHLASKSDTSSDTDSDFVRLDAVSTCSSSNENSDNEGDDRLHPQLPHPAEPPQVQVAPPVVDNATAESASSVSSRFQFIPRQNNVSQAVPVADRDDQGDTESVNGEDVDDRIESDQSEAASVEQNAEEEEAFDDIGDLPLVAGDVARQYIHQPNKRLNWTLDVVVVMVVLLAVGIGIGHSIGSMREQYRNSVAMHQQHLDLRDCHRNKDRLVQDEAESHRQVLRDLTATNSELRTQLAFITHEAEYNQHTLTRYKEKEQAFRNIHTELIDEVKRYRQENVELTEQLATMLPQEQVEVKVAETAKQLEELRNKANQLSVENEDLKAETMRLKYLLHPGNGGLDADMSQEEEEAQSPRMSCSQNAGNWKMTDLKARINQLEQENADLRAEIGRLRYKPHPGNSRNRGNLGEPEKEEVTVETEEDMAKTAEYSNFKNKEIGAGVQSMEEKIYELESELLAARRQAQKWYSLYVAQQDEKAIPNKTLDFLTCMRLLTQQLNGSLNSTTINNLFNMSRLLLSVEDVKDSFMREAEAIWREFSWAHRGNTEETQRASSEKEHKEEERPQKKWSDSVKDILNRTQSSVSDMSQQIKKTWNQVKNLSEELWKKHEPALAKVANKITEKVKNFSDKVQKKIQQKASMWFRHKKGRHGDDDDDDDNDEHKRRHMHNGNQRRKEAKKNKDHKQKGQKKWKHAQRKNENQDKHQGQKLKKKAQKQFGHLHKVVQKMHMKRSTGFMQKEMIEVCNMFVKFQIEWDVYQWLEELDAKWTLCQSEWWHNQLQGVTATNPTCSGFLFSWQVNQDWLKKQKTSDDGTTQHRKNKNGVKSDKHNKKFIERNRVKGKPFDYEWQNKDPLVRDEEKHVDDRVQNTTAQDTPWKDESKNRRDIDTTSTWSSKAQMQGEAHKHGDWFWTRNKQRHEQRKKEHAADWVFDRASDRKAKRSSNEYFPSHSFGEPVHTETRSGQYDSHTHWLFARATERDHHRRHADSWFFRQAGTRRHKHAEHDCENDDDYDTDEDNNGKGCIWM